MHLAIMGIADAFDVASLKASLVAQCDRLDFPVSFEPERPGRGEASVLLIAADAGSSWSPDDDERIENAIQEGVTVLPVIPDAPTARFLPPSASHINAFIKGVFGSAWPDCLADEILSLVWQRRRVARVFISYKRTDSSRLASQLYERFGRLGYDVFFDESSVPRGANFQRELMWWLNDTDLLVVLCSPNFPNSQWCMQEVNFCQNRKIGVAVIDWPDEIYQGSVEFAGSRAVRSRPVIMDVPNPDQIIRLKMDDFDGGPNNLHSCELKPDALTRLVGWCARQRTVGVRQRLDNLIPLARRLFPGAKPVPGASVPGDLLLGGTAGKPAFIRVVPFRPRAETIWNACADGIGSTVSGCFYEENDPLDERAQALRWLANGTRPADPARSDGFVWAAYDGKLL